MALWVNSNPGFIVSTVQVFLTFSENLYTSLNDKILYKYWKHEGNEGNVPKSFNKNRQFSNATGSRKIAIYKELRTVIEAN